MTPIPFFPRPPFTPEKFNRRGQLHTSDYEFRQILERHQAKERRKAVIEEYSVIVLAALGCGFLILWLFEIL